MLVYGWLWGCGSFFSLCAYLSLLNHSFYFLVQPLSVEWLVVVRYCRRELYGVMATPSAEFDVLVVWPLLALTFGLDIVLVRTISVHALGRFMPVYSFDVSSTPSMLAIWPCGDVGRRLARCIYFFMVC